MNTKFNSVKKIIQVIDSIPWVRIYSKGLVRWHHMHQFLFWPPGGATWIGCQCGHQMALLALVLDLANSWRLLHCHIAWDWPIDIASSTWHIGIELPFSSARVTSVKSQQVVVCSDIPTHRSDPRYTWGDKILKLVRQILSRTFSKIILSTMILFPKYDQSRLLWAWGATEIHLPALLGQTFECAVAHDFYWKCESDHDRLW